MNISCGECGADSGIEKTESSGSDAFKVQRIGWKAKMPILLNIFDMFFACSDECMKKILEREYSERNISPELIDKARAHSEEFKAKIPELARQTGEFMSKLQFLLKKSAKK